MCIFATEKKHSVMNPQDENPEKSGHDSWHWQEPGTAWRGAGVYHITLTVPSREPLLGQLIIPDGDPAQARIERTQLGNAVVDELYVMVHHYPAIRILRFCLMPDHLHAVIRVTRAMEQSIRNVLRGYWQGVKKLGRAYTLAASPVGAGALAVSAELNSAITDKGTPHTLPGTTADGRWAFPVFTERPFIRPLSRRGQLDAMMQYVLMNPQRLATKRLKPGLFRVQHGIVIGGRSYDGVGNTLLLTAARYAPVHVRRTMVEDAAHGDREPLRSYKNGCVLQAREGTVMVSPFISPDEKEVMQVLLREGHPFILLADNGFRDYYKPSVALFDACAQGHLFILSPWPYDSGKRHISRADCVALNAMAAELCASLSPETFRT